MSERQTFTAEEFERVIRMSASPIAMENAKREILAALRIAANVMREDLIETALMDSNGLRTFGEQAEAIRAALLGEAEDTR